MGEKCVDMDDLIVGADEAAAGGPQGSRVGHGLLQGSELRVTIAAFRKEQRLGLTYSSRKHDSRSTDCKTVVETRIIKEKNSCRWINDVQSVCETHAGNLSYRQC